MSARSIGVSLSKLTECRCLIADTLIIDENLPSLFLLLLFRQHYLRPRLLLRCCGRAIGGWRIIAIIGFMGIAAALRSAPERGSGCCNVRGLFGRVGRAGRLGI